MKGPVKGTQTWRKGYYQKDTGSSKGPDEAGCWRAKRKLSAMVG